VGGGKMNDDDLIELIAQMWVSHGGDTIGFEYCRSTIEKRIEKILKEKEAADE
jgi:hypothetical protein